MKKQSGALMSSKLIALKQEAISRIAYTVSCQVFLSFMQIGTMLTPPKTLNNKDFPYMTGSPAFGPMFPNPRILDPSVTIALTFLYPLLE